MKSINTLVQDIYGLLKTKEWFDDRVSAELSANITSRLREQLGENIRVPTLRLSQMGPRCPKAVWYSIHHPELAQTLPPWATIKYSFGHIIEALAIALAKGAGHTVTGEQDELVLDGIVGHRDCVIDGCVVDVKSSSSIGFSKFRNGLIAREDNFGYLDQLDGYVLASVDDPLVTVKDKGYLLVIDKQLGHICTYEHEVTHERSRELRNRIHDYKVIVGEQNPPPCTCKTVEQGSSGNVQLDHRASYSPYKYCCHPGLRTFLYANGPAYFTKVVKRPFNNWGPIVEVDKEGKVVYN